MADEEMDIIEWAQKYLIDDDGNPIKLAPWQEKLARDVWDAMERGEKVVLYYGRLR